MRNCVGSRIRDVMGGDIYFYHWDGAEPATVMLGRDPWGGWRVKEALGFDDGLLSNQTECAIRTFVERQLRAPTRTL